MLADTHQLIHALMTKLNGVTVATAESCTGGMISEVLTSVSGSSSFFVGGIVAYSNDIKVNMLGVSKSLIDSKGAVSSEVAEAMAFGARSALGSTFSISTTGIAGPTGGTEQKPVGTVFVGCAGPADVVSQGFLFKGNRREIREQTVGAALQLLYSELIKVGA